MFVDFERAADIPFAPDICIVGAGVAGLTMAWALRHSGLRVLVIEGGGLSDEARSQSLFDTGIDFKGAVNTGIANGRFRVYGGSGTRWGGQLIPLAAHEFTAGPATDGIGWPIELSTLAPYFDRLDTMLDLKKSPFDSTGYQFGVRRIRPLVADSEILSVRFSKWLPWRKRNIGRFLRPGLEKEPNIVVLYHANAVELICDEGKEVLTGVRVRSYAGREQIFTARDFVVASGAIESIRLLLASRGLQPGGVDSRWKFLGRCFMDHVVLRAGAVATHTRAELLRAIRPFYVGDVLHTPRFELSQRAQEEEGCLSGYAQITFQSAPDSAFAKLRTVLHDYQKHGVRALSRSPYWALLQETPDLIAGFLARTVLGLRPIPGRSTPIVFLFAEQPPRDDARISLAEDRDTVGMSRLSMTWGIGEEERRTLTAVGRRFEALLHSTQIGTVTWFDDVFDAEDGARLDRIGDQYHHIGGARMSASEWDGVVDTDCRVHGTKNLYVASAAVFPKSGCSNPTFTVMALALRLAEHLRQTDR